MPGFSVADPTPRALLAAGSCAVILALLTRGGREVSAPAAHPLAPVEAGLEGATRRGARAAVRDAAARLRKLLDRGRISEEEIRALPGVDEAARVLERLLDPRFHAVQRKLLEVATSWLVVSSRVDGGLSRALADPEDREVLDRDLRLVLAGIRLHVNNMGSIQARSLYTGLGAVRMQERCFAFVDEIERATGAFFLRLRHLLGELPLPLEAMSREQVSRTEYAVSGGPSPLALAGRVVAEPEGSPWFEEGVAVTFTAFSEDWVRETPEGGRDLHELGRGWARVLRVLVARVPREAPEALAALAHGLAVAEGICPGFVGTFLWSDRAALRDVVRRARDELVDPAARVANRRFGAILEGDPPATWCGSR